MDWIASFVTTSGFAIILWLSRNLIITRLTNAVKHEYDRKIEELRSSLRNNEESFKEELNARSGEIEALRSVAFASVINNQGSLNDRRVIAVEQLWQAVIDLAPAKNVAHIMVKLDIEAIESDMKNKDAKGNKFLEVVTKMGNIFDIEKLPKNQASLARPFVSLYAWALYSAYSAIILRSNLQLQLLKGGLGTKYIDNEHVIKLIEVAIPHQKSLIEKHGPDAACHLLEELEDMLLKELDSILRGEKDDKYNVERAALIINETNKVNHRSDN